MDIMQIMDSIMTDNTAFRQSIGEERAKMEASEYFFGYLKKTYHTENLADAWSRFKEAHDVKG